MKPYMLCAKSKEENRFWEDPAHKRYTNAHGEHFNDKLAEWASKRMKNVSGVAHTWTVEQVRNAFPKIGYDKPQCNTWGDATYAANMAYADYFGVSLKTEADCLLHAHAEMSDPDGYPTKIFSRWLSDVMAQNIMVPWDEMI